MEQLRFFLFLLLQSTLFGVGLAVAAATLLVLTRKDRRFTSRVLVFPAIWLAPLVLGGLFVEPGRGAKTADWIGFVALGMLGIYLIVAAWCISSLRDARWLAIGYAAANAPFLLLSALVLGFASGGTWP